LDVARTLDIYSSNNPLPLGMMCAADSSLLDKVHTLITLELLNGWHLSLVDRAVANLAFVIWVAWSSISACVQ